VGAPVALANRLIAALSGGDPQLAADATHEYVNRTFGHDTQTPIGKAIGGVVSGALAPLGQAAQGGEHLLEKGGQAVGIPAGETHGAISELGDIAGTAGVAAPLAQGAAASTDAAAIAARSAANEPGAALGFRHSGNAPIARTVAGGSGKEALDLHNQAIGDSALGSEAGIPAGVTPSYDALANARGAPNAVYGRVAAALPEGPLSPAAAAQVQAAGGAGARITQGTPDAIKNINSLKADLLDPARTFTGDQVVNEMRGLRQEGYTNLSSDDVSKQQLGKAQLDMSRGLEQHVSDTLPPGADTSMDQLAAARTALAKNYAVQSALRGPNVDLQAIARLQRADPDLLSGPMKDTADFANAHPEVSTLPPASTRYSPPGFMKDVGGLDVMHPLQSGAQALGGFLARRSLTGDTGAAVAAMPRGGLAEDLAPLGPSPSPGAGPIAAPRASAAGPLSLVDDLIGPAGQSLPKQAPSKKRTLADDLE
jgi:hypothetical protein